MLISIISGMAVSSHISSMRHFRLYSNAAPKNYSANRNENEKVGNPAYIYLDYGILLSQGSIMVHVLVKSLNKPTYIIGGQWKWVRLQFRFVAGAWAIGAFVFVQPPHAATGPDVLDAICPQITEQKRRRK